MTSDTLETIVGWVLIGLGTVVLIPCMAAIAAYLIGGKR